MQLQGRSEEATQWLYDALVKARTETIEHHVLNTAIHTWLPGVKSYIPPDYINDLNAAKQCLPITQCGNKAYWQLECSPPNIVCVVWHELYGWHSSESHINDCLSLITASVAAVLSYFQLEKETKTETTTNN